MRFLPLALVLLSLPVVATAQWLPEESFPEGGHVDAFVRFGDTVLAGSDRLFKSTNAGHSWREIVTIPTYFDVRRFERSGRAIFALCDTALWRSLDAGESWSMMLGWRDEGSAQLAIDAEGRLFVAAKRWIKLSDDNGATWQRMPQAPNLFNAPSALAYVAGRLHIGEASGHRYTTDDGATWHASSPVDGMVVSPNLFAATSDGVLHAGTTTGYYYSIDSGATWLRRSTGDSLSNNVYALAVERDTIWTSHYGFLMTSSDRGATWRYVTPLTRRLGFLVQLEWRDDTLWGASTRSGVVWSTDDGLTWHERSRGMFAQIDDNGVFLDNDAFHDAGWFALLTTPAGFLRTTDGGKTWAQHDSLLDDDKRLLDGEIYDVVRYDDTLYCITPKGLHSSTDEGRSWRPDTLTGSGAAEYYRAIEVVGDTLLAAGGMFGVVRFVRGDVAWRQIDSSVGVDGIALLARGDTIYCGRNTVWRSIDRGATWSRLGAGLADGLRIRSFDVTRSGELYAFSDVALLPALWRSIDAGENWASVDVGAELNAPLAEGAFTIAGETLFIGLNDRVGAMRGVHSSSDHGATWKLVSNGRLSDANILALGRHGDQLLAWTQSYGIWRRSLSELVASAHDDSEPRTSTVHVVPNPAHGLVTIRGAIGAAIVFDPLGRIVARSSEGVIDLSGLPAGRYVVVAQDQEGSVVGVPLVRVGD
jgi:photosystem II stability/assembly factor-like uncharacterized protein